MNFQERAKSLLAKGAIVPLAAASASGASLSLDFAGSGLYDNSGFFPSIATAKPGIGGTTQGLGFKLFGSDSLSDSAFYETFEGETSPRSDGDGLGFVWGGAVSGAFEAGDKLVAPFEFDYDFTFTPSFVGDTFVSNFYTLTIGLIDDFGSGVDFSDNFSEFNGFRYETFYGDYQESAGSFSPSGTIELELFESDVEFNTATHWYVVLSVFVEHENASFDGEPFPKLNGDVLNVTVPQNSIDLDIIPINPVPEPSVGILGALSSLMLLRRKRS